MSDYTCLTQGSFSTKRDAMKKKVEIAEGTIHIVPEDLRDALISSPESLEKWNGLTPLARNEWICWTTIVKKEETRKEHIRRVCAELIGGKRRPCCWAGCPHHRPNARKWYVDMQDTVS